MAAQPGRGGGGGGGGGAPGGGGGGDGPDTAVTDCPVGMPAGAVPNCTRWKKKGKKKITMKYEQSK